MNETIKTQLNHRSIRQFKPVALAQEEVINISSARSLEKSA